MRAVRYNSGSFVICNDIVRIVQARCANTATYLSTHWKSIFEKVCGSRTNSDEKTYFRTRLKRQITNKRSAAKPHFVSSLLSPDGPLWFCVRQPLAPWRRMLAARTMEFLNRDCCLIA